MRILSYVGYPDAALEKYRPTTDEGSWELVIAGYWSQSPYHSGHIAYFVQKTSPSTWVLNGVERSAELDDVTENDIEEGRLNDDQIQAMWGMTLEEAQNQIYEQIVAVALDAPEGLSSEEAASQLYTAVREAGGKIVDEPDRGGLLR
jgi:hypothetical protein